MGIPDKVLDGIDRLEPLPITVQKLMVALNDANVDINEITDAIELDGAITANILRTANSAAFAGRARIEHTREAVVRLGTVTLLDILLIGHLRNIKAAAPLHNMSEDDFWVHSAAASLAVKAMAKEIRNGKIPEEATIAALIHDIGKLIMGRYLNTGPTQIRNLCDGRELTSVEAESELFGCDHAQVGSAVAQKWRFPDAITRTIRRHHEADPEDPDVMLDAVMLANLTAKSVTNGGSAAKPASFAAALRRIGLSNEGCERVCLQTAEWVAALKNNYGLHK